MPAEQVFAHCQLPPGLRGAELYGYTGKKRDDLDLYVHISEVFELLRPGDSIVLTGGGHTTAAYRDGAGAVLAFDSLPASVTPMASADALSAALCQTHRGMLEFTATVLRMDTAGPGAKRALDADAADAVDPTAKRAR